MTRRSAGITGLALLAAGMLLGVLITIAPIDSALDDWWHETVGAVREPWMIDVSLFFDWIGGGWRAVLLMPLLIAGALCLARRWREALFSLAAFAVSAAAVQIVKEIFGRARPEDLLVVSDYGSFPSGHTANAATIAMVLWLIFPRMWVAVLGALWTAAMALSRTLLSVHWMTDTLGGALVGAGATLLVAAALWVWLRWNRRPPVAGIAVEESVPFVRPYQPSDRDALYDVCVKTADAGADATGELTDDRLWGDVFAVPYAERHPDLCWVVGSGDGRTIGYVVATDDTAAFEAWFRDEWWPTRVGIYPAPPVPGHPRQDWLMGYAAERGAAATAYADEYPAHLHIDLLPETQGMGLGRELMQTLFAELERRGVAGLHLSMSAANDGAGMFYQRLGMHELEAGEGTRSFGVMFAK